MWDAGRGDDNRSAEKVIKSGAAEHTDERNIQPQPKIGPWNDELGEMLAANAREAKREQLAAQPIGNLPVSACWPILAPGRLREKSQGSLRANKVGKPCQMPPAGPLLIFCTACADPTICELRKQFSRR